MRIRRNPNGTLVVLLAGFHVRARKGYRSTSKAPWCGTGKMTGMETDDANRRKTRPKMQSCATRECSNIARSRADLPQIFT
jgi:hypothetical protein